MSDLIERDKAIEAVLGLHTEHRVYWKDAVVDALKALPSAQPDKDALDDAYAHGYTAAESEFRKRMDEKPEQRWIPCSERLPDKNGRYLVTRGLKACNSIWNRVYIVNYSDLMGLKAEKIWWDGNVGKSDFQKINDVVAWRELSEPWRGEENGKDS